MTSRVQLKAVLLGQMDCGKTCLVTRYMSGTFSNRTQTTIGAAFCQRNVRIGQRNIVMGIWDTAGTEQFQSMSSQYYRGAKAAIICYDITASDSFDKANFWIGELQQKEPDCKLYLCGCKLDLPQDDASKRAVDSHDASDLASDLNAKFIETSSKSGENVDRLFLMITQDFAEATKQPESGGGLTAGAIQPSVEPTSKFSNCPC